MTLWTIVAFAVMGYVVNTLAFLTAYVFTEQLDHWRNDRRWRREKATMTDAHTRGTPRGGKHGR